MNGATVDEAASMLLSPTKTPQIAISAIASTCVMFLFGGIVERWLIAVLRPSAGELTWIGDVILATGFGVVFYLWLHLRAAREALHEAERAQIVMNTQFEIAANIQRSLLPSPPASRRGVSWAVQLTPAYRIGGDYYDFVDLDGDCRVFIIGDISGKGVPAAMMLAYVRAVFRLAVRETREPPEIVARLAEAIHADTGGNPYMTCIVGRVDEAARRLSVTNAGHPGGVMIGNGTRRIGSHGPPAGLLPQLEYEQDAIDVRAGDRAIFVTDGISERLTVDLPRAFAELPPRGTASQLCASVVRLAEGSRGAIPVEGWDDDRTVLVLAVD
jgi:Stage II sporulation protein E (SpoIIE)